MTTQQITAPEQVRRGSPAMTLLVIAGAHGLAWTTGFRGFMAEIAGPQSVVDRRGTFGWVLLPGVIVGVLLGWAEHLCRPGGRKGWRWLALSPLLFSSVLFRPGVISSWLEDGIGTGDRYGAIPHRPVSPRA
jgi:hypothetical protein